MLVGEKGQSMLRPWENSRVEVESGERFRPDRDVSISSPFGYLKLEVRELRPVLRHHGKDGEVKYAGKK